MYDHPFLLACIQDHDFFIAEEEIACIAYLSTALRVEGGLVEDELIVCLALLLEGAVQEQEAHGRELRIGNSPLRGQFEFCVGGGMVFSGKQPQHTLARRRDDLGSQRLAAAQHVSYQLAAWGPPHHAIFT